MYTEKHHVCHSIESEIKSDNSNEFRDDILLDVMMTKLVSKGRIRTLGFLNS